MSKIFKSNNNRTSGSAPLATPENSEPQAGTSGEPGPKKVCFFERVTFLWPSKVPLAVSSQPPTLDPKPFRPSAWLFFVRLLDLLVV